MRGCINKAGNSWGYTITIGKDDNGKRIQKRFGKFTTKKEAINACNEAIYRLEHGTYIEPTDLTIARYLRDWLETHRINLAVNTYRGYKVNIENHIIPAIGHILLQKLQPIDLQKFYSKMLEEKNLSPSSISYVHATLRKCLNEAMKMQYVSRNVAMQVTTPKARKYNAQFLNTDEIKELLQSLQMTDIYIPTLIAIYLGLRRGEVLGLMWKDVDFEKGLVTVSRAYIPTPNGNVISNLKTEKSNRVIGVPDNLIAILKEEQQKQVRNKAIYGMNYNDYVCCKNDGTHISPDYWYKHFKKVLASNWLKDMRLHDLRHTNASLMLKAGVNMKVASERLGHTTIGITMDLYSHIDEELQRDAADKLNNIIDL